ncbi:MAG: SDR family NAD(P)-dependent oxidoreductase [Lutispora sp.]|nr:SDR family NAD(P)-dependent oxidoreductase [Lutispora sp.]
MKDYLNVGGKIAIVTGSGRGIGRGIAIELASYGVKVMVCDINDETGESVKKEIIDAGGVAEYCHCDIMKIDDIKNVVAQTVKTYGTVDILINNGGGGEPPCDFDTITDERWDRYIRFNLYSAFYMIREVFPYMKKQNSGKIVNISSGYAIGGGDKCAHYASAKAGVIGLTTSIAKEAAPYNINVNVIPVPTTDTPGLREADFEFVADEIPLIPLGRIAQPLDIANTVLFLISGAADYVTGQIVASNGGKRMLV